MRKSSPRKRLVAVLANTAVVGDSRCSRKSTSEVPISDGFDFNMPNSYDVLGKRPSCPAVHLVASWTAVVCRLGPHPRPWRRTVVARRGPGLAPGPSRAMVSTSMIDDAAHWFNTEVPPGVCETARPLGMSRKADNGCISQRMNGYAHPAPG